jgi:hypothetical protein
MLGACQSNVKNLNPVIESFEICRELYLFLMVSVPSVKSVPRSTKYCNYIANLTCRFTTNLIRPTRSISNRIAHSKTRSQCVVQIRPNPPDQTHQPKLPPIHPSPYPQKSPPKTSPPPSSPYPATPTHSLPSYSEPHPPAPS